MENEYTPHIFNSPKMCAHKAHLQRICIAYTYFTCCTNSIIARERKREREGARASWTHERTKWRNERAHEWTNEHYKCQKFTYRYIAEYKISSFSRRWLCVSWAMQLICFFFHSVAFRSSVFGCCLLLFILLMSMPSSSLSFASFTVIPRLRTVYKTLSRLWQAHKHTRAPHTPPSTRRSKLVMTMALIYNSYCVMCIELELTIINSNIALFNSLWDFAGWLTGWLAVWLLFFIFLSFFLVVRWLPCSMLTVCVYMRKYAERDTNNNNNNTNKNTKNS